MKIQEYKNIFIFLYFLYFRLIDGNYGFNKLEILNINNSK